MATEHGRDGWVPWLECNLCGRFFRDPSPARESDETAIRCDCTGGLSVATRRRFQRGYDPRGVDR